MDLIAPQGSTIEVTGGKKMLTASPKHQLEVGPPSAEMEERAKNELRETPERREEVLRMLRDLIEADETLNCRMDDEFLLRFLRPAKFYPESALEKIRRYLDHMKQNARMYEQLGLSNSRSVLDTSALLSVSPLRDQLGRRVTILRFGAWTPKMCTMDDLHAAIVMCAELGSSESNTQIAGSVAVIDMRGTALRHVTNLSPSYAKRTIDWIQGGFPIRFKAFHVINQPRIFNLIYSFFKPFMGEKLRSRIHFHGSDLHSLTRHVDPACLSREHGGLLEDYDQANFVNIVRDHDHIFKEIRSIVYDSE